MHKLSIMLLSLNKNNGVTLHIINFIILLSFVSLEIVCKINVKFTKIFICDDFIVSVLVFQWCFLFQTYSVWEILLYFQQGLSVLLNHIPETKAQITNII